MFKYLLIFAILVVGMFVLFSRLLEAEENRMPIEWDDWVCWASSTDSSNPCGTLGYSKSKKVALYYAMEKCKEHCQTDCKLDYCEKIVKPTNKEKKRNAKMPTL